MGRKHGLLLDVWVVFRIYKHQQIVCGVFANARLANAFCRLSDTSALGAQHHVMCWSVMGSVQMSKRNATVVFIVTDNADSNNFTFLVCGSSSKAQQSLTGMQKQEPKRWLRIEQWGVRGGLEASSAPPASGLCLFALPGEADPHSKAHPRGQTMIGCMPTQL